VDTPKPPERGKSGRLRIAATPKRRRLNAEEVYKTRLNHPPIMVDRLATADEIRAALLHLPTPSKNTGLKFCARSLRTLAVMCACLPWTLELPLWRIETNSRTTHAEQIDSGTEQIHATCNPDKIRFQPFPHGALKIFRRENRDPMDLHALTEAANMNHSSVGKHGRYQRRLLFR